MCLLTKKSRSVVSGIVLSGVYFIANFACATIPL